MKRLALALVLVSVGSLIAVGQFHYAFYYDLTNGQDVEITISNPMFDETQLVISVFDAYGAEIWSSAESLASAESGYIVLGEYVPYADYPWGVVTVDSTDRLIIGLEYYKDDLLVSVDTVVTEVPELDAFETFWLGTYYSQAGVTETAFIVMNPWPMTTTCDITAYNSDGYVVYTRTFTLSPYESEYVDLTTAIGSGGMLWGLLDVAMENRAVVIALEYYGRGCSDLEIDNVTDYYF